MKALGCLLLLCVIVTLQLQASGFFIGKPGCPLPSRGCQNTQNQCSFDFQCGRNQKCCNDGCSFLCKTAEVLSGLYNPFFYAAYGPGKKKR